MKYTYLIMALCLMLVACGEKTESDAAVSNEPLTGEELREMPWQEIAPRDIETNAIQLFADEWFELSAGNDSAMNLMTIAWGSLGQLWNKPVVTVYVSTSRYTYEFMEKNDYFTLTHFPQTMREQLQYLGSVSGRDENKVEGAGLTVEFTELGNPIFSESDLAIECRKLYTAPFDESLLPEEQRQWYEERGIGVHVAYVGEIVHVWKK